MIKPRRLSSLAWLAAPLGALAFIIWLNVVRIQHVTEVSALGGWSEKQAAAGNSLIIPEHLAESYHWIAQTQQMLSQGEWRVRRIDYENAPVGLEVRSPSPYRGWLGSIAWCDHWVTGRSPAQSVERAALVADPLLHFLLVLGTTLFVAWRLGALPAALIAIGFAILFPFATQFLPGVPDDRGLAHILSLWSVLLLLAGIGATATPASAAQSTRRWFFSAGLVGGLALWVGTSGQAPILAGIGAGALFAAWTGRTHRADGASFGAVLPWRAWAAGGAITTLGAYLIEFAPAHLGDWRLDVIHPLYGLAWLGGGEVLAQTTAWIQGHKFPRTARNFTVLALAVLAFAALPLARWKIQGQVFFDADVPSLRLTPLPDGAVAQNLGAWIAHDGPTLSVWATVLPLLLLVPAIWSLARRSTDWVSRVSTAVVLGPVLVALGLACSQLAWWNEVDGLLLLMFVASVGSWPGATHPRRIRIAWTGFALLVLLPGVFRMAPRTNAGAKNDLSPSEVFGLVERDLAGWLALHSGRGNAVILAPPNETTALCYYGGMRGIGTLSWENKDGVAAAMRILSASTAQEAKELIERREISHLIFLSWDSYFDEYARAGTGQIEGTFLHQLRSWDLPPWLRPLPYQLPAIAGFEGQSATLFAVVDDQNEATALGRTAEYFIEMGELDKAASAAQALRRFPGDAGAWVARAEVELARGDEAGFAKSLKFLQSRLATKTALALPWDLRVGLAVLLAKAKQQNLSRDQVHVCLETADETKLHELSTGALYRLLVLSHAFELNLAPQLNARALELLPSDLRDRLPR